MFSSPNTCWPGSLVDVVPECSPGVHCWGPHCVLISSKQHPLYEITQPMRVHSLLPAFIFLLLYGWNKRNLVISVYCRHIFFSAFSFGHHAQTYSFQSYFSDHYLIQQQVSKLKMFFWSKLVSFDLGGCVLARFFMFQ